MTKSGMIALSVLILGLIIIMAIKMRGASAGEKSPDFKAELIDGTSFELSELKGNYVLIDFWASWCGPCRAENPKMAKLYKQFKDKEYKNAQGFHLVTIALEKTNGDAWKAAAKQAGFDWKYQIVEQASFVVLSPLARKFGVTNLPSKILINPDGHLIGDVSLQQVKDILSEQLK